MQICEVKLIFPRITVTLPSASMDLLCGSLSRQAGLISHLSRNFVTRDVKTGQKLSHQTLFFRSERSSERKKSLVGQILPNLDISRDKIPFKALQFSDEI